MLEEKFVSSFKKNYKKIKKQGKDLNILKEVIILLKQGKPLPQNIKIII